MAAAIFAAHAAAQDQPPAAEPPKAPAASDVTDIAVRIADLDGKPIVGADVRVSDGGKEIAAATCDDAGLATLAGVPRRDLRITVTAAGRFPATGVLHAAEPSAFPRRPGGPAAFEREWTPVASRSGGPPAIAMALVECVDVKVESAPKGARVVARVVAAPLQIKKMRGVVVNTVGQGEESLLTTIEAVAEEDRDCVLRGVPAHSTVVARIEEPGTFCRAVAVPVGVLDERSSTVHLGKTGKAWTLAGRVLDAAGEPVPKARVHVAPADAPLALAKPDRPPESRSRDDDDVHLAWSVTCDEKGAYAVPFLEPGTTYAARAEADGALASPVTWDLAMPADTPPSEARLAADLVVAPLLALDGLVQDGDGVQPPRGVVRLRALPRDDGVERETLIKDGVFRFEGLLRGRYGIHVEGMGFRARRGELVLDPARPGVTSVQVDAGAVVTGRVVDLEDKPVKGAHVQAFDPEIEALQVIRYPIGEQASETAADGTFRIAGLTAKAWNLRVSADDGVATPVVAVTAPAKDVTIRVGPPPKLRFGIRLPEGVGMKDVKFGVFKLVGDGVPYRAGEWDREALDSTTAAFRDLPADEDVIVRFVVPGHPPYMQKFRLAPGETRDLGVIEPPAGHVVEGVVRDSKGAPVADVRVSAELAEGEAATTDDDGRFKLENVGAGEQRIRLTCFGSSFTGTDDPTVTIPAKAPLALTIRRWADVRGRVVTVSGKSAGRRVVFHAVRPWGRLARPQDADVADDGTFDIRLAPERYRVTVYDGASDGAIGPTQEVDVTEDPGEPLELTVPDR